jgi:hypothetical protein
LFYGHGARSSTPRGATSKLHLGAAAVDGDDPGAAAYLQRCGGLLQRLSDALGPLAAGKSEYARTATREASSNRPGASGRREELGQLGKGGGPVRLVAAIVHGRADGRQVISGERGYQQSGMPNVMHSIFATVDSRKESPTGHGVHSHIRDEEHRT